MAFKPGDFFLGVIDFFGVLIPGAVLLYLHGSLLFDEFSPINTLIPDDSVSPWVLFLIVAYVSGELLLGLGVPLNRLQEIYMPEYLDSYYEEVKESISRPPDPHGPRTKRQWRMVEVRQALSLFDKQKTGRPAAYHRAYSYVRLHSAQATAEIDRQAAEYKLFRGLVLVSLLDFPLAWLSGSLTLSRAVVVFVLLVLALWRFLFLLNWARQLTFEFYALLTREKVAAQKS